MQPRSEGDAARGEHHVLRLSEIERRDWHLWSLALLMIVALALGIFVIRFPSLVGEEQLPTAQFNTYLIGLSILAALFCAYAVQSVSALKALRRRLSQSEGNNDQIQSLLDVVQGQKQQLQASEEAFKTANAKLRKLDQLKTDLISTVSHELRTPLTSIKNAAQLMLAEKTGTISSDQRRFLQMVLRNIDRLGGIVNDLLNLAKLESGNVHFHFTELELGPILKRTLFTFSPEAESRSLALSLDLSDSLPNVLGDQNRIEQILCNLLSNALKFTPAGGRVTLSARSGPEAVIVGVADTGVGMSAEDCERAFDRFHQAGDAVTRTATGTGLGLSIAKEMVEAQGGRIWVDSEINQGSCFSFELPVCSQRAKEMAVLEAELRKSRDDECVSILVISLDARRPATREVVEVGEARTDLERFSVPLAESLYRKRDTLLVQPAWERMIIVLPETPAGGALQVHKKVETLLKSIAGSDPDLWRLAPIVAGQATYPEDGTTGRALVERALAPKTERSRAYG